MIDAPAGWSPSIQLIGAREQALRVGRQRLALVALFLGAAFFVIVGRLVELTLLQGEVKEHRRAQVVAVGKPDRAEIVDRNGLLVAGNLATASLFADPRLVFDAEHTADKLMAVLPGLRRAEVVERLRMPRGFVWLQRNLTPRQQQEVAKLGLPGLDFQAEFRRVYPLGPLAAHVVGLTDIDKRGIAGIEKSLDAELQRRATTGEPLQLSLDIRVQHALREELQRSVAQFRADGGAGLLLDVQTGEVLALVSLPDFDANNPTGADRDALFNRMTLGVYELGSVFKIITVAIGLDSGATTLADGYDASRPINISHFTIKDDHPKARFLTVPEILVYSSNIGAAKMALDYGTKVQQHYLHKLGLLQRAPVELPEVGMPLIPSPWREINTMTIAFGHGVAVSPLQFASAVAAVVNGGIYYPPTVLKRQPGEVAGQRVLSAETSQAMRRLLRQVVVQGTGKKADVPGYSVGGKTGTAEKTQGNGYSRRLLLSSFVGVFPSHDPRYVIFALLDEPQGTKETHGYATAGWTAAPTVARIIERIAPLLSLPPMSETVTAGGDPGGGSSIADGKGHKVAAH